MAEKPETTEAPAVQDTATSLADLKEPAHVSRPDSKKQKAEEDRLRKEIDDLEAQLDGVSKKHREAQQAANGQNDGASGARAELKRLKKEKDDLMTERRKIFAARDEEKESRDKQMNEMAKIKTQTKYKTVGEVDGAIQRLEKQQSTTSMSLAREKEILKEIAELKQAKKLLTQRQTLSSGGDSKPTVDYQTQLSTINARLKEIKVAMDQNGAILTKLHEKKKDTPVTGLIKKKDELRTEKRAKQDELRKLKDEFKTQLQAWKKNQEEWKVFKASRDRLYKEENERRREAERKEREEEMLKRTPYEEEMQLCDYLTTYLTTTYGSQGAKAEAAPASAGDFVVEGGSAMESKKGKEDPYLVLGGGKKKKGGKKGKKGGKKAIVLVPETIDAFSLLKLDPPTSPEQVEASLEQLRAKKEYFSTLPRGEIESIAEKNQKFENQRGERPERRPREPKQGKKSGAVPNSSDMEAFPSLAPAAAAAAEETA